MMSYFYQIQILVKLIIILVPHHLIDTDNLKFGNYKLHFPFASLPEKISLIAGCNPRLSNKFISD